MIWLKRDDVGLHLFFEWLVLCLKLSRNYVAVILHFRQGGEHRKACTREISGLVVFSSMYVKERRSTGKCRIYSDEVRTSHAMHTVSYDIWGSSQSSTWFSTYYSTTGYLNPNVLSFCLLKRLSHRYDRRSIYWFEERSTLWRKTDHEGTPAAFAGVRWSGGRFVFLDTAAHWVYHCIGFTHDTGEDFRRTRCSLIRSSDDIRIHIQFHVKHDTPSFLSNMSASFVVRHAWRSFQAAPWMAESAPVQ